MYGQQYLYSAIVDVLRADTVEGGLVSLTGHSTVTTNGYKIGRKSPIVKGRTPYVGVHILVTVPLLVADVPFLQRSMVEFYCIDNSELTAIKLADRIETLLHGEKPISNRHYLDFSSIYIGNKNTSFKFRQGTKHSSDTDTWEDMVSAQVIWSQIPCRTEAASPVPIVFGVVEVSIS